MEEPLSLLTQGAATIVQRKVGVRLTFVVQAEGIKYTSRERLVKREAFIPYEAINPYQQSGMILSRSPLMVNLFGLSVLYLLMAAAFGAISPPVSMIFIVFSVLAAIAFVIGRLTGWTDLRFILLPLVGPAPGAWGPIKIIKNPKGDCLLDAIRSAWADKLKRLYGNANLSAEPTKEVSRLTWLRENHVLSQEEWEAQVARVNQANVQLASASDRTH